MITSQQVDIAENVASKMLAGKPGILGVGAVKDGDDFVIRINVERGIPNDRVPTIPSEIEGVRVKISRMNPVSIISERAKSKSTVGR